MKRLALILLAFSSTGSATQEPFIIVHDAQKPVRMCVLEGEPISCAYLLALIQLIRDEQFPDERGI